VVSTPSPSIFDIDHQEVASSYPPAMARSASPRRTVRIARPIAVAPVSAVPAKKALGPRMPNFSEMWKAAAGCRPSTKNSGAITEEAVPPSMGRFTLPSVPRTVERLVMSSSSRGISLLPPRNSPVR